MGCCLRQLQLFSTCMAFSLGASVGTWKGAIGNWSMFIWCFCFVLTLLILIVELCGLEGHFPFSWDNFLITWACYVTQYCLSASISNPLIYLQSCLKASSGTTPALPLHSPASVVYATDVAWTYAGLVSSLALCLLSQDCLRG